MSSIIIAAHSINMVNKFANPFFDCSLWGISGLTAVGFLNKETRCSFSVVWAKVATIQLYE
jgi:hypothetical protein